MTSEKQEEIDTLRRERDNAAKLAELSLKEIYKLKIEIYKLKKQIAAFRGRD